MKTLKTVLAIILLATFSMNAQKLTTDIVDDFTGDVKKITRFYKVGKGKGGIKNTKLMISAIRVGENALALWAYNPSISGFSGAVGNYIIFKFLDGTTLKIEDSADIDCGDYAQSTFLIMDLTELIEKEIVAIRLSQQGYGDYEPTGDYTISDLIKAVK